MALEDKTIMPKTGERAKIAGIYRSRCCKQESTQGTANRFPPCTNCGNAAVWVLVMAAKDAPKNAPRKRRKKKPAKKGFWDSLFS